MKKLLTAALLCCAALPTWAKLPAPSDDAKAKAAEAAAKTAHVSKVASYQLCQSMDKVATFYFTQAKTDGKAVKPADKTDACADPGAFVYAPPVLPAPAASASASVALAGAAPAVPAAPAAATTGPVPLPKK